MVADGPGRVHREHRGVVELRHRISVGERAGEGLRELEPGNLLTGEVENLRAEGDVPETLGLPSRPLDHTGDNVERARVGALARGADVLDRDTSSGVEGRLLRDLLGDRDELVPATVVEH